MEFIYLNVRLLCYSILWLLCSDTVLYSSPLVPSLLKSQIAAFIYGNYSHSDYQQIFSADSSDKEDTKMKQKVPSISPVV